jgi:hypothetical protein
MEQFKLLRIVGIISSFVGIVLILFGNIKTVDNFRIVSDFLQNILLLNLVLLLFLPSENTMKISILTGVFNMTVDFILETVAVYLDWWYPLGGTQFPPLIVVPLEMVSSFFLIGTAMGIMITFPQKIIVLDFKLLNWVKTLFKNEKFDTIWRILFMLLIAIIGTNGDYTAGPEIWAPGPYWLPLYTFFVWFFGGLTVLLFYSFLERKIGKKSEILNEK